MKRFDYLIPSTANTPPYLSDYFKVLIQIIDVHRQQTLSLWFNFVENVDDVFRFVKKKICNLRTTLSVVCVRFFFCSPDEVSRFTWLFSLLKLVDVV